MSEPMQIDEYLEQVLTISMIQEEKNYLKEDERSGDSTKAEKVKKIVINAFKEAQEFYINDSKTKMMRDDEGNITRNGKKIKSLERTSVEGYLKMKKEAKAQER